MISSHELYFLHLIRFRVGIYLDYSRGEVSAHAPVACTAELGMCVMEGMHTQFVAGAVKYYIDAWASLTEESQDSRLQRLNKELDAMREELRTERALGGRGGRHGRGKAHAHAHPAVRM